MYPLCYYTYYKYVFKPANNIIKIMMFPDMPTFEYFWFTLKPKTNSKSVQFETRHTISKDCKQIEIFIRFGCISLHK